MLKGISPVLSPELIYNLAKMGHGDELILADAHFPGDSFNDNVVRADGLRIPQLLDGILPLFEPDSYVGNPFLMMAAVEGDLLDPSVEGSYMKVISSHCPEYVSVERIDRFAFYERARSAFCVVMTGELAKYGNIILKKGVTPVEV